MALIPVHDLVIRNGTIVDGTGAAPREGDVAITGGRISAIGKVSGSGREEIDACGKLVTPGFVDVHTHYDGQAVWDSHLAPSAWHGVTTAVMGNCGVGFAPCRAADRDKLIELMEGVEDIPGPVLHEGLVWSWESFPEYLATLDRQRRDLDLCALLPHAAVRVYVMGERAIQHEKATREDIARMRALAREAVRAGAFGFSTSRTIAHKSVTGEYTPTLRAHEEELTGIALGLKDAGSGFVEIVSDWRDARAEMAMLRRVAESSGRPILYSLIQWHDPARSQVWRHLMDEADAAVRDGVSIRGVFPPRAVGSLLGLEGSQNPFSGTPTYRSIAHLGLSERVAAMRDPEIRRRILSEDPIAESTFPLIRFLSYDQMFPFGSPPNYLPRKEDSAATVAKRTGRSAADVAYDWLLLDEGRAFLYTPLVNYADFNLSAAEAMLANRNTVMGLGDGGAHVGFILDAGFPTWLLTYWGKERRAYPVEELVRRLTSDPAGAVGLSDRGTLTAGKKADINIIDYDKLSFGKPYLAFDLPAGGRRLLQKASGFEATILSGKVTYRDGQATGALPGRLIRGPQGAARMAAE